MVSSRVSCVTRPIILAEFHRVVLAPKILAVAVTMFSAAIGGVDPRARFCKDGWDTPKSGKKSLQRLLVVEGPACRRSRSAWKHLVWSYGPAW